jgi:hypothetical protein
VRLGKKLGVVEDRRTIMADQVLLADEVKVPVRHRIATGLTHVPMYVNDRLGDCTQAKKGHAIMTMERASSQSEIQVTDDDVVRAYMRVGGYVPGHPETDNGAYELDSLNDWRQNGIGVQRDGTPHKIDAFVRVDHTNHDEVLLAHYVACLCQPSGRFKGASRGTLYLAPPAGSVRGVGIRCTPTSTTAISSRLPSHATAFPVWTGSLSGPGLKSSG